MVIKISDVSKLSNSLVDNLLLLQSQTHSIFELTQSGIIVSNKSADKLSSAAQSFAENIKTLNDAFEDIALDAPEIEPDARAAFEKALKRLRR